MRNRKFAFSTMGFAIVFVIIIGIVMIISAPMMADKYKDKTPKNNYQDEVDNKKNYDENENDYKSENKNSDEYDMLRRQLERNKDEISSMESRILSQVDYKIKEEMNRYGSSGSSSSDKYVCSIEGYLDPNGNVVPISSSSPQDETRTSMTKKFVFVCQYNR